VYLNNAVFESGIDIYDAYLVSAPTVRVSLGEPETVTDSEKLAVKVGVSVGMYVLVEGPVTDVMLGSVLSSITALEFAVLDGPVEFPKTELAAICIITVPSPQAVTANE
jgi:hypothetical protein